MAQIHIGEGRQPSDAQQKKHQARQALRGFDAALADVTDNWGSLTAAQKTEAVRVLVVILARAVRWLVLRD